MPITDAIAERLADGTWEFTWTAGTSPYAVWLDGSLLSSGLTSEEYTYTGGVYIDDAPPLEILEDGDTAENSTYPPIIKLQWRGVANAYAYEVYQYIASVWTSIAWVMETERGYYVWTSQALDDATTHQFRVLALSMSGNEGTPVAFSIALCCNPAPPDVGFSFDSAGDLVVSEA